MNTLSPAPLEFEFGANTRSILSEIISKYPVCAFNSISMGFVNLLFQPHISSLHHIRLEQFYFSICLLLL
jgi:hypothetical protein